MKLLKWLYMNTLPKEDRKYLAGDLEEIYQQMIADKGRLFAACWFIGQIIVSIPYNIKNRIYWGGAMFRNYLKIAVRNLVRHKGYSFINIFGLAVGMACSMLVLLWVFDELSFDQFHKKADNLYRVTYSETINGDFIHYAVAPYPSVKAFFEEIPEVVDYSRLYTSHGILKYKEKKFEEDRIYYVDSGFLKMLSFPLIEGDINTVLTEPNSIVITRSIQKKIFGDEFPIGKVLSTTDGKELKVTGVVEDVPKQSHLDFDYLVSINTLDGRGAQELEAWLSISGWCYVELNNTRSLSDIEKKMNSVSNKYMGGKKDELGMEVNYYLQNIQDIHLKSDLNSEYGINGDIKYVYIFSFIALFILAIACINFMNLSTARAANRAKEVGLRKVVGAHRKRLISQFFTESFLITMISLLFSILLILLSLSYFNILTGKEFTLTDFYRGEFIFGSIIIVLITSLLAGSYPSFYLSRFDPAVILKGISTTGASRSILRKSLVVFQFTISVLLIAGTFIMLKQVDYMKTRKLGVENDHVLVMEMAGRNARANYETFANELLRNPEIKSVSNSSGIPGDVDFTLILFKEDEDVSVNYNCDVILCDYNYLDTYGMSLSNGRNFSKEFGMDSTGAFIINQAAADRFGWGNGAVGKKIGFSKDRVFPIVGVIDNFNYASLKYAVDPLILRLDVNGRWYLSAKLSSNNLDETINFIKQKWNEFEPERSLKYFFADEHFNSLYKTEEVLSNIVVTFSGIAILIACMGLFGLTAYSAIQRRKEIGVRKVLGASISSVITILIKEYVKLIIIACLVGLPIAYFYFEDYWLADYSYRVSLGPAVFILPFLVVLVIAMLTASYQAVRAALSNPVDSLRNE